MKAIKVRLSGTDKYKGLVGKSTSRGSITAEAAIALPVFLCIVLTIIFMIKAVYVHEIIQHSLKDTADELATMSYLYYRSGLMDLDKGLQSGLDGRADEFREQIALLESIVSKFSASDDGHLAEVISDMAGQLAEGASDSAKSYLFVPLTREIMKANLLAGRSGDISAKLEALSICGGFEGLDFSDSTYFSGNDDIDLVVKYRLDLPLPIDFLGEAEIIQRVAVKAWAGGDDPPEVAVASEVEDIWELDNFTRGRRLRGIFGANLPYSFPVISAFNNGNAIMIKSIKLTADSYSDTGNVKETVSEYIRQLSKYEGQEEPWGSSKIIILKKDIVHKELLLVIPGTVLSEKMQQTLDGVRLQAAAAGIELRVEQYGVGSTYNKEDYSDQDEAASN